jgi:hypothetical protein
MVFTDEQREFLQQQLRESEMSQLDFADALKRRVHKGIFSMDPTSTTVNGSGGPVSIHALRDADTLYVKWFNVDSPTDTRGAKGMNNRILLQVSGFTRGKGKLQVELLSYHSFDKLRKKTATPQKILDYVAAYLEKQAEKETI